MHVASGGGSSRGHGRKRNMNFDLNLVPFIDMLATCICFLLMTAVFINLGSVKVNQAVGTEKSADSKKAEGSITVTFGNNGDVRFEVKDVKGLREAGVSAQTTVVRQNDGSVVLLHAFRTLRRFC
jgi:biopolymer transport protein ExbD